MIKTKGIHHVSSIVGHAQSNIDFNAGVLGQRLVKQTLNFDDKNGFHLYFGNYDASTGLTTTFPMIDSYPGKPGGGQVEAMQYAVKPGRLRFWKERLEKFKIPYVEIDRFSQELIRFSDPSGLTLEISESEKGKDNSWSFGGVGKDQQITGIEAVTLLSRHPDQTLYLLTDILGYSLVEENDEMYRLRISEDLGGQIYLSKAAPKAGTVAVGSVHHLALRIENDEIEAWKDLLEEKAYRPTEIKDRKYFRSIYFREKGGILIELATEAPGMLVDETVENLGMSFLVPPSFADMEAEIKEEIMPLFVREVEAVGSYSYRNRYEYELVEKRRAIQEEIKQLGDQPRISEDDQKEISRLKREFVAMK